MKKKKSKSKVIKKTPSKKQPKPLSKSKDNTPPQRPVDPSFEETGGWDTVVGPVG